jgi:O-methyltransferase
MSFSGNHFDVKYQQNRLIWREPEMFGWNDREQQQAEFFSSHNTSDAIALMEDHAAPTIEDGADSPLQLYLELLKCSLMNSIYKDAIRLRRYTEQARVEGRVWPEVAHTMVGQARLDNVQFCVERILKDNVPGDVIETGVWRGGSTILMRGVLKAHGVTDRTVWVADSFQGLPAPSPELYPADAGANFHQFGELAVPLEQVQENFRRYGLLDGQVRFLKGWFKDTLPTAPIGQLAVARLDGDMYESTMDALTSLYPKLSVGGYLIVDDYGDIRTCRQAVTDYREAHGITEEIIPVDWTGVYWRREK